MTFAAAGMPLSGIEGAVYRIVASRFPPIGVWDRIADPADFDALAAIESLTNERLREEMGALSLIPRERRVAGPGTMPIMAAFTHLNPELSRFSDGTFGVFYAARAELTAIRETAFHRERFLAATRQPAQQVTMRCYVSSGRRPLHDIRTGYDELHHPDPTTYPASATFARQLRAAPSEGIVYRSVRHAGGECVAIFWPDVVMPCVQGSHFAYHWDGKSIAAVSRLESVPL
jgi:RES domain